jgi:hypothetical protein
MAESITWTTTDESGRVLHRPATAEVLTLFKQAYFAENKLPTLCPLIALQDETDYLGIPWLSVMAALTDLVQQELLEIIKLTHKDALDVLQIKRKQLMPFTGAKTCAWCSGTTLVLIAVEYDNCGAMVCGNCAAEYEYLVTQQFYQATPKGTERFNAMLRAERGGGSHVQKN